MKSLRIVMVAMGGILSLYGVYMTYMMVRKPPLAFVDVETSPLSSIMVRDDTIVATMPDFSYWMVKEGSAESRKPKSGESFVMHAGSSLSIFERHSGYTITAQLAPKPGIMVEAWRSRYSFGGEFTKKLYFIQAAKTEKTAVSDGNKSSN